MVIDNNDSGTFRPVAMMIVGKAETVTHLDHFGPVASIEEITGVWFEV